MKKKKFYKYDMRSEFEIPIYVSKTLSEAQNGSMQCVDTNNAISGILRRKDGVTTLELSTALLTEEARQREWKTSQDDIVTEKECGELYATTWNGDIQFIIRKYRYLSHYDYHSFNSVTRKTATYTIADFSMTSQFPVNTKVYRVQYDIDYVHEFFKLSFPSQSQADLQIVEVKDISFDNQIFSIYFGGRTTSKWNGHFEQIRTAHTNFVVNFKELQDREFTINLGMKFRNLFHILINQTVGLSKILINKDKSTEKFSKENPVLEPKDERENLILNQTYLPKKQGNMNINLNIEYSKIEKEFNDILYKYFESQKLQDLIERYLTVGQNQMRVSTALLVLTSAIESYIRYENGKNPNLQKKLNLIICGDYNKENIVSKIIKDNRDWYIHAEESKQDRKLSETNLLPYVIDLQNYLRGYILKELGVEDTPEIHKLV